MTETVENQALLQQNRDILARHAKSHDLREAREIDISSRFRSKESARAAREYVERNYEVPSNVLFRVVSHKYTVDDIVIELAFSFHAVPEPELITNYEFILRDAAEKFEGETPGWEVEV